MALVELIRVDLERESQRTKRILAEVSDGKGAWKPHDRSMAFAPLAHMVATIPSWIAMEITMNELDIAPVDGPRERPAPPDTSAALLSAHEEAMAAANSALAATTDEHLRTSWKLLAAGQVVVTLPRHEFIRDTISHWAHHRGQMSVYLRLMGAKVPSLYGPSADDPRFL